MIKYLFIAAFFISCGSNEIKVKDGKVSVADAAKVAKEVGKEAAKSKNRWEERKAKGDTVAIPYKDLQAFLPDIEGYEKKGDPKGKQMSMRGLGSWSEAEQRYVSGDKTIRVKIVDYNSSQMAFTGAAAIYKMGFSSEDDNKKQGSVDIGAADVVGYETIYKKRDRAELACIAGDRFLIDIDASGTNNGEMLKAVAKKVINAGLSERY